MKKTQPFVAAPLSSINRSCVPDSRLELRPDQARFDSEAINATLPEWIERESGHPLKWSGPNRFTAVCPFHEGCGKLKRKFQGDLKGTWLGKCWIPDCPAHSGDTLLGLFTKLNGGSFRDAGFELSRALQIPMMQGDVLALSPKEIREKAQKRARMGEERSKREKLEQRLDAITKAANAKRGQIFKDYGSEDWRADAWDSSEVRLKGNGNNDWRLLLRYLFTPDDQIWISPDRYQTGKPEHSKFFKAVGEVLEMTKPPGYFFTGCTFPADAINRSKGTTERVIFRLIEADELIGHKAMTDSEREENKRLSWALFQWLEAVHGFRMTAIIDTGSKSLHGLVRLDEVQLDKLNAMYRGLGLDDTFNNPSTPLRLPGCIHEATKKPASLISLNSF